MISATLSRGGLSSWEISDPDEIGRVPDNQ